MSSTFFLKFFYKSSLIYEASCKLKEEHLDNTVKCTYFIDKPSFSFGFNKVAVSSFGKDIYWMSFEEVKYIVKDNYPLEVVFNRKTNSIDYIMED